MRAPRTTWKFVTITPSRAITTPEASPLSPLKPTVRTLTTEGSTFATTSATLGVAADAGGRQAEREQPAEDERQAPHGSRWPHTSDAPPAASANSAASPTSRKLSSRHSFLCPSREARSS